MTTATRVPDSQEPETVVVASTQTTSTGPTMQQSGYNYPRAAKDQKTGRDRAYTGFEEDPRD